ncbi:MAG: Pyridoxine 5'-phosphate synthase [Alphaproteobacteria bacterium MarineAlpha11_Bin1]|nr:MAG: Pyridoxine 5'-phosphate synthase [Alphaproteobacteria bacterium MarineAlpha11_Bin1]
MNTRYLRLGVNIDHVATIRNARGGEHPDPVRAALVAASAGADGITAHLREDRRHMTDRDIIRLTKDIDLPLNLEMAATDEMLDIALRHEPHAVCIVPEKRRERTTEGGLEVVSAYNHLEPFVRQLSRAGIKVSLFIEPTVEQVDASVSLGAQVVELHTGAYCDAEHERERAEFERIVLAAAHAEAAGIECHAGHGLNFDTVVPVAAIPTIQELNIGHFLIGEAIFNGLERTIKRMRTLMDKARAASVG